MMGGATLHDLMVRSRAQRGVSNHGRESEVAAILRDGASRLLRMRAEQSGEI